MSISTLLWIAAAGPEAAAGVAWETSGAFETYLEARAKSWIDAKVELVVSDDPAASNLDDLGVAKWTMQALKGCEAQAGRTNSTSEQLFVKYMVHWREHIDAAAEEVRRRLRPD